MTPQQLTPIILIVAIILVVGLRIWRSTKEQRFQPSNMWFLPILFAAYVVWLIVVEGYTRPLDIVLMVVALAVGGAIGMYQGTHTTIRVDHAAHAMFVKISPLGTLIFISVVALRIAIRYVTGSLVPTGGAPALGAPIAHTTAGLISLVLLVLAVGVIAGLRAYLQRAYDQARATL